LEANFRGQVQVHYYDALNPAVRTEHAERMQSFEQKRWPYPIALVNGEVVSVGSVSSFVLFETVQSAQHGG
jgi:disulfide oxidoreductase YuzD